MTMRFAFYGRVSTEDRQDPEASRAWQLDRARRLVEPAGGVIVAEYFDLGVSRRLPWARRPQAKALLDAVKNPARGFDAIVIGEAQRAFQGSQFDLIIPVLNHYGVALWLPDLNGPVEVDNVSHDLQMSIMGVMSKTERTVIRGRVKDSMRAIAAQGTGRHMGGRPPYGYRLVDAGPHPNPSKASDGKRLHRLEPDPVTAPAVRLIFGMWCSGHSLARIAEALVASGHPSPSAHDRERNPHRLGEGWAKSAVRAILRNPRYTGHEVWGRQPASYELIDPDNPSWGDAKAQRWAPRERWTVSEGQAHEPLVTIEVFEAAQRRFSTRPPSASRKPRTSKYEYLLPGRVSCAICKSRMEGSHNNGRNHYRCRVGNDYILPEGAQHPRSNYLREDLLTSGLDQWISTAFSPVNLEATLTALLEAQERPEDRPALASAEEALEAAERRLERLRLALETDADLSSVVGWIREAERARDVAAAEVATLRGPRHRMTEADLRGLVAQIPDLTEAISASEDRAALYAALDVRVIYDVGERLARVTANAAGVWGSRSCPRGDLNPHSHH